MGIGVGIIIDISHDLACGGLQARIAGIAQTAILRADHPETEFTCNGRSPIRGPVVHDNDFIVGILQFKQALAALTNGAGSVAAANDHGNAGPVQVGRKGDFAKGPPHDG